MLETKVDKIMLDQLKAYKDDDIYKKSLLFPSYYIGSLESFILRFSNGGVVVLKIFPEKRKEFISKMSDTIQKNEFDYLDNIVLEIISNLHFVTHFGNIIINIDEEQKKKFIKTCNDFKGKEWNDILSPFIDTTYELLCKCTIQGGQLLLGARMWL